MTRGDNSGKTRNTRRLFFHEESIHEVSRRYLEHEYVHTDKPKPICPPLFQSWGHKNFRGGGRFGGGVRVDVNEELKFLCKFKKKLGGGGSGGGVGGGVRGDENEELKFL